jgi:hypothetical protein
VLVECKLWRNPEGRREVVGQILDYAKELSRWSSSDLHREVRRRLKRDGNPLLEMVRTVDPTIDEIQLNDALTSNLRRGRFLLLIVGDGIREGVEAIAEYLQMHAGLHFSLGLVELPIYIMPNGDRLVTPRVLARTTVITRNVVVLPDGYGIQGEIQNPSEIDADRSASGDEQRQFWTEFLDGLKLDDPEQPMPKPARLGYISFSLPAPTSWLTVYRSWPRGEVGVYLSSWRNTPGAQAMEAIVNDWDSVQGEIGGSAKLGKVPDGRPTITDSRIVGPLDQEDVRKTAFSWLGERVNAFVNIIRPRLRSAAADFQAHPEHGAAP